MKFLKHITATTILTTSLHCYATVGGGQTIEVLGYEAKQQKLYLLRHYEDERGRLPQLYYYQLNSKTPDKLIEVQSLYINPKTHQIDYDQNAIQFEKDLNKIKKRLTPLLIGNANTAKVQIIKNQTKKISAWYDDSQKITEYKTTYNLKSASLQSHNQVALNYGNALKISQTYSVPKQNKLLIVVKYFGIPEETGYDFEDAILLLPIQ